MMSPLLITIVNEKSDKMNVQKMRELDQEWIVTQTLMEMYMLKNRINKPMLSLCYL